MSNWILKQGQIKATIIFIIFAVVSSVIITGCLTVIVLPMFNYYLHVSATIMIAILIPALAAPVAMYPIVKLLLTNKEYVNRIKELNEIDAMTGTYRREYGLERLNKLISIENHRSVNLSICFIDIDDLKKVNDEFGHAYGDEFLIVFIGLNSNGAESVWERIAERLNDWNIKTPRKYIASASHGIVGFGSDHLRTLDELIKDADERMYRDKNERKEQLQRHIRNSK